MYAWQPDVFFLPVAATPTEEAGQRLCMHYAAHHDGLACAPLGCQWLRATYPADATTAALGRATP